MTITRSKLRDLTFKLVFEYDFYPNPELDSQVELFLAAQEGLQDEDIVFITERTRDIFSKIIDIDKKIDEKAEKWSTARMSRVDLSIIRLALYEAEFDDEVPEKVAFNEAVELAKTYGGDESPKFVNGVLGKLSRE